MWGGRGRGEGRRVPIPNKRFKTIEEARRAMERDSLATVYTTARIVTVMPAFGTGQFSKEEWDRAKGEK